MQKNILVYPQSNEYFYYLDGRLFFEKHVSENFKAWHEKELTELVKSTNSFQLFSKAFGHLANALKLFFDDEKIICSFKKEDNSSSSKADRYQVSNYTIELFHPLGKEIILIEDVINKRNMKYKQVAKNKNSIENFKENEEVIELAKKIADRCIKENLFHNEKLINVTYTGWDRYKVYFATWEI